MNKTLKETAKGIQTYINQIVYAQCPEFSTTSAVFIIAST